MTVKTDAQLKTELDTTFYTNGANLSTGALTNTHLTNAIESKVSVIDAETINGVKTFGSFPVTPSSAPTTDYQVANKKYVDDNEVLLKTKIELTAANVNSLGTAFELLHIPGAGFNYKIIGISVKMITTTILDAGIQVLNFIYGTSGERIADLSNPHFEGTSGTSTKFSLVIELKDLPMDDNESIECVLNSATNPTGEAEMEVTIYYTLETY